MVVNFAEIDSIVDISVYHALADSLLDTANDALESLTQEVDGNLQIQLLTDGFWMDTEDLTDFATDNYEEA